MINNTAGTLAIRLSMARVPAAGTLVIRWFRARVPAAGVGGWLDPLGGWTPGPTILGQLDRGSNCPAGQLDPPWMDGPTAESA